MEARQAGPTKIIREQCHPDIDPPSIIDDPAITSLDNSMIPCSSITSAHKKGCSVGDVALVYSATTLEDVARVPMSAEAAEGPECL